MLLILNCLSDMFDNLEAFQSLIQRNVNFYCQNQTCVSEIALYNFNGMSLILCQIFIFWSNVSKFGENLANIISLKL